MTFGGFPKPGAPGVGDCTPRSGHPRAVIAAAVSAALSALAHGFGGGAAPHTAQTLMAVALSAAAGWLVATAMGRQPRVGWSWSGIVGTLTAAQMIGHLTFTLGQGAPAHGGHAPTTQMVFWHVAAILVAATALVLGEHFYRIGGSRIRGALRAVSAPYPAWSTAITVGNEPHIRTAPQQAPVGLRAPPVALLG